MLQPHHLEKKFLPLWNLQSHGGQGGRRNKEMHTHRVKAAREKIKQSTKTGYVEGGVLYKMALEGLSEKAAFKQR